MELRMDYSSAYVTKTECKYLYFRKIRKGEAPVIINGLAHYKLGQTEPITGRHELACLKFARVFLAGQNREQFLKYPYDGEKCTQFRSHSCRISLPQHFNGRNLHGVFPRRYTRWIDFE